VFQTLRIGIIGGYDSNRRSHTATNEALHHAANALSVPLDIVWLPTQELEEELSGTKLKHLDAFWCAPGSPYNSPEGALKAIRFCREQGWPFIGT
jgi:CTP synthase (UTP-ammonia lyase)